MNIRHATLSDIEYISKLEIKIDKDDAASLTELVMRFELYPEGFFVAEGNGVIVGYIESCLCDLSQFERYNEIKDFSKHHNPQSDCLYIIFVGVDPENRHNGIATKLLQQIISHAKTIHMQKIQLIATETNATKEFLISFYKKNGFRKIRILEHFSPECYSTLMELVIND